MDNETLEIIASALTVQALKGESNDKAKAAKKAALDQLLNLWSEKDSHHQLSSDDTTIVTNIVRDEVLPEETEPEVP